MCRRFLEGLNNYLERLAVTALKSWIPARQKLPSWSKDLVSFYRIFDNSYFVKTLFVLFIFIATIWQIVAVVIREERHQWHLFGAILSRQCLEQSNPVVQAVFRATWKLLRACWTNPPKRSGRSIRLREGRPIAFWEWDDNHKLKNDLKTIIANDLNGRALQCSGTVWYGLVWIDFWRSVDGTV